MGKIKLGRFMDLRTDFGFKKLLGTEDNKALLIDILNTLLDKPDEITNIRYLPTEYLGSTEKNRKAVFDIHCVTEGDDRFIIEMQVARQPHILERMLFYSTFLIQEQAKRGKWNFELQPHYIIAILDFNLFEDSRYIRHLSILTEETGEKVTDTQNFIVIELRKCLKTVKQSKTRLDRWLYCFNHLGEMNDRPKELSGKIFKKLFEEAEINKLTSNNMVQYEKSVLEYDDVRSALDYNRKLSYEEGIKNVAKNLLKLKFPIADITKATGLTPEQIRRL